MTIAYIDYVEEDPLTNSPDYQDDNRIHGLHRRRHDGHIISSNRFWYFINYSTNVVCLGFDASGV